MEIKEAIDTINDIETAIDELMSTYGICDKQGNLTEYYSSMNNAYWHCEDVIDDLKHALKVEKEYSK